MQLNINNKVQLMAAADGEEAATLNAVCMA